jgi:hypothetical protein
MSKPVPSLSKLVAQAKARKALRHIETAQNFLRMACEELCPIDGMCPEWDDVGDHYDKVKALWHRVNMRANADDYDLDRDARTRLTAKAEAHS